MRTRPNFIMRKKHARMEVIMTFWEVILLVTGFVCLCASYYINRGKDGISEEEFSDSQLSSAIWTEKEEQMIQDRVAKLLEEQQTVLLDTTTEELNHLCNDKIIAIDEFSKPLLEKIENNHQEVVFMYNMLNEKEKEIKKILAESVKVEERKPEVQDIKKEQPVQAVPAQKVPVQRTLAQDAPVQKAPAQKAPVQKSSIQQSPAQPSLAQKAPVQKKSEQKKKAMPDGRSMDVNGLIQKMYKEGKSILEISKALNIGQGEVKLVITLYGGKGR